MTHQITRIKLMAHQNQSKVAPILNSRRLRNILILHRLMLEMFRCWLHLLCSMLASDACNSVSYCVCTTSALPNLHTTGITGSVLPGDTFIHWLCKQKLLQPTMKCTKVGGYLRKAHCADRYFGTVFEVLI